MVIGVSSVWRYVGDNLAPQFVANRRQRGGHVGDPAAERGAREIEVLAIEDPFQAIERQMIDVLRHDHVREQPSVASDRSTACGGAGAWVTPS